MDINSWLMVFLRASGLLAIFPVFSSRSIPVLLRVSLGALLAFLVYPYLPRVVAPDHILSVFGLMAMELLVGLLLGFVGRMIFYALDITGGIVTAQIGLNLSANINPLTEAAATVPGNMLHYLAAMLWLSMDLHHWFLAGFQRSYDFLPVGGAHLPEGLVLDVIGRSGHLFLIAAQMSAPVIAVSFLVTLVFSVMGRAVPQMNVFFESFAFRIITGLIVFGLSLQIMAQYIVNYLRRLPEDILQVAQMMGM